MSTREIDRRNGSADWIDVELDFVQRERTSERIADVGTQLRLVVLSLSNTKQHLESLGVERQYNRVRKAELQRTSDATPDHVAVGETVIQVNDERRRIYVAVGSETNDLPHVQPSATKKIQRTVWFLMNFDGLCRVPARRFWPTTLTTSGRRRRGSGADFE